MYSLSLVLVVKLSVSAKGRVPTCRAYAHVVPYAGRGQGAPISRRAKQGRTSQNTRKFHRRNY